MEKLKGLAKISMDFRFVDNYLYYLMFTSILRGEILTIKVYEAFKRKALSSVPYNTCIY